ncbi:MAG: alpha/beta hydrolase [Aurantibacter sp.]
MHAFRINKARIIVLVPVFLLMVGCSFGQIKEKREITEHRDIDYLEGQSVDTVQRLNLVLPEGNGKYPLLIWIGGGAWSYVDRNVEMDLAKKFAREGIGVASVGHRLSSARWQDSTLSVGIQHPKHIQDVASSIKWLYDNAPKYGYDKEKIFIGGFSSGAHLAALIGLDDTYLKDEGLTKDVIKGMIPISGTYDILNYHEVFKTGDRPEFAELHVETIFGDTREDFINASPTSYLGNLGIPILLISDNALDQYTKLFEKRLKETDFKDFKLIYVPDLNHGELWRNLSLEDSSIYRTAMLEFIRSNS